jgi:hypothetical protein
LVKTIEDGEETMSKSRDDRAASSASSDPRHIDASHTPMTEAETGGFKHT